MSKDDFFDERWVLKFLGISKKTMQNWDSDGKAPVSIKKGRVTRYPKKEFWAWYMADTRSSRKKAS